MSGLFANRSAALRLFTKVGRTYCTPTEGSTQITTLNNGVRVASLNSGAKTCSVGIYLDVGSRYETAETAGLSHFLQHLAYKGTGKRSGGDIENQSNQRGAYLRASTSRELNSFTAQCLSKDLPWALELLSEVALNTDFDETIIEKQKKHILKEFNEAENDLKTVVLDYLHATAYQGTPLARPVIGQPENIAGFTKKSLATFIQNNIHPSRVIVAVAGGVKHDEIVDLSNHFLQFNNHSQSAPERKLIRFTGSEIRDRDDAYPFAHISFAVEGPGWTSVDTIPLRVASVIAGSWDRAVGGSNYAANKLAKRFFDHGVIHAYNSFLTCYHDTSLWGIHCISERFHQDIETRAIFDEWMRITCTATDFEVERVKRQIQTGLLTKHAEGGLAYTCDEIGQHVAAYGRHISLKELIIRLQQVDASSVREVCDKYVFDNCFALSAFGPIEDLRDYNGLRNKVWTITT